MGGADREAAVAEVAATDDRAQIVAGAVHYLERKDVKRVLYEMTEALLVDQPDDPAAYLIEVLGVGWPVPGVAIAPRRAGGGGGARAQGGDRGGYSQALYTAAVAASSAFLEAPCDAPRPVAERLLAECAAVCGCQAELFARPPSCPVVPGQEATPGALQLAASSSQEAQLGSPTPAGFAEVLKAALAQGIAGTAEAAAAAVRTESGIEGILLLHGPSAGQWPGDCGALSLLPALRLFAQLLAERLDKLAWRARADAAMQAFAGTRSAIERLAVHGKQVDMAGAVAGMVPQQLLRTGISVEHAALWTHDFRTGELVMLPDEGVLTSSNLAHMQAAKTIVQQAAWGGEVLCVPDVVQDPRFERTLRCSLGSTSGTMLFVPVVVPETPVGEQATAVVQYLTGPGAGQRPDPLDVLLAGELRRSPVLLEALRARACLLQLLQEERRYQALEQMVLDLAETGSVAEMVRTVERSVPNVLDCEKCTLYFIDEEVDEVWAPPTDDLPDGIRVAFGEGFAGMVAQQALDDPRANAGVVISNDPKSSAHWKGDVGTGFEVRNLMTAPIWSGKSEKRLVSLIQVLNKHGPAAAAGRESEPCACGSVLMADAKFCRRCGAARTAVAASEGGGCKAARAREAAPVSRSANFTQRDKTLLEVLAKELGTAIQHLLLDMMWTKARMDTQGAASTAPEERTPSMVHEYYRSEDTRQKSIKPLTVITSIDTVDFGRIVFEDLQSPLASSGRTKRESVPSPVLAELLTGNLTCAPVDVLSWRVDYWSLGEDAQFHLFWQALARCGIFEELSVPGKALYNFFNAVRRGYRANPYHNFHHALSTLHYAIKILDAAQLHDAMETSDKFALVIGCLAHDLDHRGRNNSFEMMTRSELALRYNDSSPLENHHCARAFEIALGGGGGAEGSRNIFRDLAPEVYAAVRKQMVTGILSTDMKHHGHHVTLMQVFEVQPGRTPAQCQFLVELLMHTADIGNPMMDPEIAGRWNKAIAEEFHNQAEMEAHLGLPVTQFMTGLRDPVGAAKSQLGFIDFVLQPLATSIFRAFSGLSEARIFLEENRQLALDVISGVEEGQGHPRVTRADIRKTEVRRRRTRSLGEVAGPVAE